MFDQVIGDEEYHKDQKHGEAYKGGSQNTVVCKQCIWDKENLIVRKDCKCDCHHDGKIRHTKDSLCCAKPNVLVYGQPCSHPEHACMIEPEAMMGLARITDVKHSYPTMVALQEYTGGVMFGYDPNNKSLDIHFKRGEMEWDNGAGIQINNLSENDKKALREYLDHGE